MTLLSFFLRAGIYILCLLLSYFGMSAVHFEKIIKSGHVWQAQLLYALLIMSLAYCSAQFILGFLYRI